MTKSEIDEIEAAYLKHRNTKAGKKILALVKQVKAEGGDFRRVMPNFVDPAFPAVVKSVKKNWEWIQSSPALKTLYLVKEISGGGAVV